MILVKANADSEAGVMPSEQLLTDTGAFNEELVNAGVMLEGEGLHPSSNDAAPARVFAAYADPAAKARWFVGPDDWESSDHTLEFRVGGREHVSGGPKGRRQRATAAGS